MRPILLLLLFRKARCSKAYCLFALATLWLGLAECNRLYSDEAQSEVPSRLLPDPLPGGSSPGMMLRDGLLKSADRHFENWKESYAELTGQEQLTEYQIRLQQSFLESIGQLPPLDSPLQAKITGQVDRPGYRVEKILFQSQPNFYVTAALFLPDPERFPPPWPAVVVVCGHSAEGKLQDGYQRGTALAAINGMAAMIVDPIGQGERLQILDREGQRLSPTTEHTLVGTGAILVGWNTARWMIHDGMRAVDYLQSRSDIQSDRIGVMGNSGGGTQTCYLMALDDRVVAAAPSCYLTTFRHLLNSIGPQDAEQNIFGQLAWGMDHADFLLMRAPRPTLIACATDDYFDIEGTWATYRNAKRVFHRLGLGRNVELVEVDAPHGWHPFQRSASVQFMRQHLCGSLEPIEDPEVEPLSESEMQVTPDGQVLKIDGVLSAFDHVRQESDRLTAQRKAGNLGDEALAQQIRAVAGIRTLGDIPDCGAQWVDDARSESYLQLSIASQVDLKPLILQVEEGILLPGVLAQPRQSSQNSDSPAAATCLFLTEGFASALGSDGELLQRCQLGESVLAVDLRGVGETVPVGKYWYSQRFGLNGGNAMLAYLQAKSLVGIRAEDMLACARWLRKETGVSQVNLVASGELTSSGYLAGFLEPELFDRVTVRKGLQSWTQLAQTPLSSNQIPNTIHGILRVVDLPELEQRMGDRLTIEQPHDARDRPIAP